MGCFVSKKKYLAIQQELEVLQEERWVQERRAAEFNRVRAKLIQDRNTLFDMDQDNALLKKLLLDVSMDMAMLGKVADADIIFESVPLRTGFALKANLLWEQR